MLCVYVCVCVCVCVCMCVCVCVCVREKHLCIKKSENVKTQVKTFEVWEQELMLARCLINFGRRTLCTFYGLCVCVCVCVCVCLFLFLFFFWFVCLFVCFFVCLFFSMQCASETSK